jgi:hypothetical protein
MEVKLGDFGSSRFWTDIDSGEGVRMEAFLGNAGTIAPEMLEVKRQENIQEQTGRQPSAS